MWLTRRGREQANCFHHDGAHFSGLGGPLTDEQREVWRAHWKAAGMPITPPPHGLREG